MRNETLAVIPGFSFISRLATSTGVIGHDVLHRDRGIAYLDDFAAERRIGEGIDRECDGLPHGNAADIRFTHVGIDLHLGEVLGNENKVGACKLAATV